MDRDKRDEIDENLFDHDYDGIKEYDNPLPRWWVVLFIASIVLVYPYVLWFHFGAGLSIWEAYDAEQAAYANKLIEAFGELEADAPTIIEYMDDETAMAGMSALFKGRCSQCHLADGSGNVGPNLTDSYWLNVEEVTDIASVLRDGLVSKGMPAWGDKLTETQIVLLSSYVARLSRDPVQGREPQGEEIGPWTVEPAAAGEGATY